MKRVILAALLIGISTTAMAREQTIDPDCQKMAQNAKAFATLKATGIAKSVEQFQSFVVTPVVQSYPIKAILQYVFDNGDKTPDQLYQALYGRCVIMGYKDLYGYFQDREATAKVQVQLDKAIADNTNLQASNIELQEANEKLVQDFNSLRQELTEVESHRIRVRVVVPPPAEPTPIRAYGSPIPAPIVH